MVPKGATQGTLTIEQKLVSQKNTGAAQNSIYEIPPFAHMHNYVKPGSRKFIGTGRKISFSFTSNLLLLNHLTT